MDLLKEQKPARLLVCDAEEKKIVNIGYWLRRLNKSLACLLSSQPEQFGFVKINSLNVVFIIFTILFIFNPKNRIILQVFGVVFCVHRLKSWNCFCRKHIHLQNAHSYGVKYHIRLLLYGSGRFLLFHHFFAKLVLLERCILRFQVRHRLKRYKYRWKGL